ncbi:hypothetical protein FLAG1_11997 [Fusarium langsethiae]|uniref:Uncharacterized protein n=1 Tax=Fusarium langsethiae TaxID=179993 RepID=A0A0N0DAH0_FUSLA|nr:hypothetical protein FLAG1_11997 [Fusarium langsethiae]GKU09815.1 unnamed protein product [Fusarium langsethiae]GKU16579.1 unnamed protein product [Fusarium langsethiae]
MDNKHDMLPDHSPQQRSRIQSARKITPPECKAPPSPPATAERTRLQTTNALPQSLVDFKRKAEAGDVSERTSILISKKDYNNARDRIESIFSKFDYDPGSGCIILHMPSATHEAFVYEITRAIHSEVARVGRENPGARGLTSQICGTGSARIFLDVDSDEHEADKARTEIRRQPDAQFEVEGAALPGVVIEVSRTQDGRQMPKIAKEYIHHSDGLIKVVICIDINSGKESTISVWKPRFIPEEESDQVTMDIEQAVKSKPFRTAEGNTVNNDSSLILHLHEFAPDELSHDYPNLPLSIPYHKICEFLNKAERLHERRESQSARDKRSAQRARVKKRKLSSSSGDGLDTEDEEKFAAKEKSTVDKDEKKDGDYAPRPAKKRAQRA